MRLSLYTAVIAMCLALSSCVSNPVQPSIHVSNILLYPIWDDSLQSRREWHQGPTRFNPEAQPRREHGAAEISDMNSRTFALEQELKTAGFQVTRLTQGQPDPPVPYPRLIVLVGRYGGWCLQGLVSIQREPEQPPASYTRFEIEQRERYTRPAHGSDEAQNYTSKECSEKIVRELLQKVRP
jgi:hypothetical protein